MVNKVFSIALAVFVIDRILKIIFFNSSKINSGAAFNILPGQNWLFILVAVIVVVFIINHRNLTDYQIGMGLLMGGTLGNLIDRFFYSGVVDFISIWIIPTFNVADLANVVGALLIICRMYKKCP